MFDADSAVTISRCIAHCPPVPILKLPQSIGVAVSEVEGFSKVMSFVPVSVVEMRISVVGVGTGLVTYV